MQRVQSLLQGIGPSTKPAQLAQQFQELHSDLAEAGAELGPLLPQLVKQTLPFVFIGNAYYAAMDKRNEAVPAALLEVTGVFLSEGLDGSLIRQVATEKHNVAGKLASMIHSYARNMQKTEGGARLALAPLLTALRQMQPRPDCLTAVHADFFQACLSSRCLHVARPVLEEDVLEVDPTATGLKARDFLLYCYFGGTIALTLKDLPRALDLFTAALTCPADGLSAVTLACYKRFVLASLMREGRVGPLPKAVGPVVQRQLKPYIQVYNELTRAFEVRDRAGFQAVLRSHEAALRGDENWGLALQCQEALVLRMVQALTQTYLTLSLEDIARKVGLASPAEAEAAVLRLCAEGKISASIDVVNGGKVEFRSTGGHATVTAEMLDGKIKEVVRLVEKVQQCDHSLQLDRSFIARAARGKALEVE